MSDIYLSLTETPSVVTLSQPVIASSVAATVTVGNTVTVALDANSLSALENVTVTVGAAVSVSNFPSTQTIAGTVTANLSSTNLNSVTIGVRGTVTANTNLLYPPNNIGDSAPSAIPIGFNDNQIDGAFRIVSNTDWPLPVALQLNTLYQDGVNASNPMPISGTVTVGNSVTIASLPAISGTVTVNSLTDALLNSAPAFGIAGDNNGTIPFYGVQLGFGNTNGDFETATQTNPFPIRGTVTIGSLPAISGTVTAAAPNGSLTTRFGTPTTASVAFATSCVTNANRKYLLIQNVTTGSNVITVGIGFTPTTTQGIQLTAGAGITFESSYIPTGAVYVLSSVTASNFTILEA